MNCLRMIYISSLCFCTYLLRPANPHNKNTPTLPLLHLKFCKKRVFCPHVCFDITNYSHYICLHLHFVTGYFVCNHLFSKRLSSEILCSCGKAKDPGSTFLGSKWPQAKNGEELSFSKTKQSESGPGCR